MSGSITDHEKDQFAAECKAVFEDQSPTKLHLVFFSHEVCAHDTIERDSEFVFNARGGGGTAFSPVFEHIEAQGIQPAAIVFLTDLCCSDFGNQPDCPVLWVSTEYDTAPFGEVVMMT
jgi:predicted metal-dependent peptidase